MTNLKTELLNAKENKNCKELFEKIKLQFGIGKLAPAVQNYITEAVNGKEFQGPLDFKKIEITFVCIKTYGDLYNMEFGKRLFPALLVATEFGGCDFWMLLENGTTLCIHHEVYEEVIQNYSECKTGDYDGFLKKLEKNHGLCKIDKLLKFQEALKAYDKFYSIDPILLYATISKLLNISLPKLLKRSYDYCYEFLSFNRTILKEMIETEKILEDLNQNPLGVTKLSLNYLATSQLMEIAGKCHNLRELEISHSPSLQWEEVLEPLSGLGELTYLSLEHNSLSSIPKGIEKLEHLTHLILSNNNIISFDESIEAMKWLLFLNLKNNPIGNAAKERLVTLLPNANVFLKRPKEWKGMDRKLDISEGEGIEHYAFIGVEELPLDIENYSSLKSILIQGYDGCYLRSHKDFIEPLARLKELRSLYLIDQQYINVEAVIPILQRLEKLECLGIDIFTDSVGELEQLYGLRELSISISNQVDCKKLYKTLSKLVKLQVLRIVNFKGEGFQNVIRGLKELVELELVLNTEYAQWEQLLETLGQFEKLRKLKVQFTVEAKISTEGGLKERLKEKYPEILFDFEEVDEIPLNCMPIHNKNQIEGCEFKLGWMNYDNAVKEILSYENLKSLKLIGRSVELPSRLKELGRLETLIIELADCQGLSSELKDSLPASLRKLALRKWKGIELSELSSLASLEELEVIFEDYDMGASNIYQHLFEEAANMQNLKALFVRNLGQYTVIPDSFAQLKHLETLSLIFITFTKLINPDKILNNISGLSNLKSLILIGGTFEALPPRFEQQKQLKLLDLCCGFQNGIEPNLSVIGTMEQLEYLSLSMKELSVAFDSLKNLKNLKEIMLSGYSEKGMKVNHIVQVCKGFQKLCSLSLKNTSMEDEEINEAIADLHNLRFLKIVMEGLQRLPDRISELTELDTLKVSVSKEEINRLKKLLPFCDCLKV